MDCVEVKSLASNILQEAYKCHRFTYLSDYPHMCNVKFPKMSVSKPYTVDNNLTVFYLGYSWEKGYRRYREEL